MIMKKLFGVNVQNYFNSSWSISDKDNKRRWVTSYEAMDSNVALSVIDINDSGKDILSIGTNPSTYSNNSKKAATETWDSKVNYRFNLLSVAEDKNKLQEPKEAIIERFRKENGININIGQKVPLHKAIMYDQILAKWCEENNIIGGHPGKLDNTRSNVLNLFSNNRFYDNEIRIDKVKRFVQLDIMPFRTASVKELANYYDKITDEFINKTEDVLFDVAERSDFIFCGWGSSLLNGLAKNDPELFKKYNRLLMKLVLYFNEKTFCVSLDPQPSHPVRYNSNCLKHLSLEYRINENLLAPAHLEKLNS